MNWKLIETQDTLEEIKTKSFENSVVIFKHSTRCVISKMVKSKFENKVANSNSEYEYYLLDLLKHRGISNEIASVFGVIHQSPQVIVIKEGKAIANASHYDIMTDIEV